MKTYFSAEEKLAPGFNAAKNCVTVMLSSNMTSNCKIEPVMVHIFEKPCALKGLEKKLLSSTLVQQPKGVDDGFYL